MHENASEIVVCETVVIFSGEDDLKHHGIYTLGDIWKFSND